MFGYCSVLIFEDFASDFTHSTTPAFDFFFDRHVRGNLVNMMSSPDAQIALPTLPYTVSEKKLRDFERLLLSNNDRGQHLENRMIKINCYSTFVI